MQDSNIQDEDAKAKIDWNVALHSIGSKLGIVETQVLRLLAEGKTQSQIGSELGLHRSAVWRRVHRIRQRLAGE